MPEKRAREIKQRQLRKTEVGDGLEMDLWGRRHRLKKKSIKHREKRADTQPWWPDLLSVSSVLGMALKSSLHIS